MSDQPQTLEFSHGLMKHLCQVEILISQTPGWHSRFCAFYVIQPDGIALALCERHATIVRQTLMKQRLSGANPEK